ncbi:protein of unknown function [Lysobacter sp. yr284]|uniref:DUF4350 domain-containing protein n=1 Tax=Lysobacter sp. yr284 TaxID=1761791 RepID=UPI0008959E6E|nr:DUF4350 domain-containing protein [Lysobacter sp. yr284]SDZ27097.1 protein of unknown function [Lysobacter sp. yr284]
MSRQALIAVALLALAALLGFGGYTLWRKDYVRSEEMVDLPRTGEAASNPLYVLKLALAKDGAKVDARQRLLLAQHPLQPRDTVLIYRDPRTLAAPDAKALLEWVARGGHLIVRTPPWRERLGETKVPVLDEVGVTLLDAADNQDNGQRSGCANLHERGREPQLVFCGARRFYFYNADAAPEAAWGDEDSAYVYARLPYGEGKVDVLADMDFLSNRGGSALAAFAGVGHGDDEVAQPSNAAFARQVLAPNYRAGTIHLIYAADVPSLWQTLIRNSWMAWLPLLLWLAAWLWQRMQRFGPLRPAPAMERRSLLEHIVASGEHIYRYGYGPSLYASVRAAFLLRLRRRDPYAASIEGEAQVELLAQRYKNEPGLGPAQIRDALAHPLARDHAAFRTRIATLIRMRNRL